MSVETAAHPEVVAADRMPEEVVLARDRRGLKVVWPDGRDATLAASALRTACRCAWCTRDRVLGRFRIDADGVELKAVEVLGSHGLHIRFSDGHERGIFPWLYLDELARGQGRDRGGSLEPASQPDDH